jgi:hypothetical protein
MAELHDRMPAILSQVKYDAWLRDGELYLLRPFEGEMYAYPVNKARLRERTRLAFFFFLSGKSVQALLRGGNLTVSRRPLRPR